MAKLTPFLMFEGRAEEAMNFYFSIFSDGRIESITRYGHDAGDAAGKVVHAIFTLSGQRLMCIDSPVKHGFTFTPATSLHVAFETEAELDAAAATLGDGGQVLMPLAEYPFARKYTWLNDKFGVSWQLALAS